MKIPSMGGMGAAITTVFSYFLLFIIHDFTARHLIKGFNYKISFYIKGICPIVLSTVITYLFMDCFIIRWFIAMGVGVCLLFRVRDVYKRQIL